MARQVAWRALVRGLALAVTLAAAACGDDGGSSDAATTVPTTIP